MQAVLEEVGERYDCQCPDSCVLFQKDHTFVQAVEEALEMAGHQVEEVEEEQEGPVLYRHPQTIQAEQEVLRLV